MNGKVILTPETAALLEKAIGVSTRFWLALEAGYRADLLKVERETAALKEDKGLTMQEWISLELTPMLLSGPPSSPVASCAPAAVGAIAGARYILFRHARPQQRDAPCFMHAIARAAMILSLLWGLFEGGCRKIFCIPATAVVRGHRPCT